MADTAPEPVCVLLFGNPGVGKSTLLNTLLGRAAFDAGLSLGSGRTTEAAYNLSADGRHLFADTPGLDDVLLRARAADALTAALARGGAYKLVLVTALEAGCVRAADLRTAAALGRALAAAGVAMDPAPVEVWLNKVSPGEMAKLREGEEVVASDTEEGEVVMGARRARTDNSNLERIAAAFAEAFNPRGQRGGEEQQGRVSHEEEEEHSCTESDEETEASDSYGMSSSGRATATTSRGPARKRRTSSQRARGLPRVRLIARSTDAVGEDNVLLPDRDALLLLLSEARVAQLPPGRIVVSASVPAAAGDEQGASSASVSAMAVTEKDASGSTGRGRVQVVAAALLAVLTVCGAVWLRRDGPRGGRWLVRLARDLVRRLAPVGGGLRQLTFGDAAAEHEHEAQEEFV